MNLLCPTTKPTSLRKHSSLIKPGWKERSWRSSGIADQQVFANFWKCLVLNWAYMPEVYHTWMKARRCWLPVFRNILWLMQICRQASCTSCLSGTPSSLSQWVTQQNKFVLVIAQTPLDYHIRSIRCRSWLVDTLELSLHLWMCCMK